MNHEPTLTIDPCTVWIVMPAFNEAQIIGKVIDELYLLKHRVVVVDDASTDATYQVVMTHQWVDLLRHPVNLGQGAALQTGITYALSKGAQYIVTFDADGQHRTDQIQALLRPLSSTRYDVVLGSRFLTSPAKAAVPFLRRILLHIATYYTRLAVGLNITDTHNGLRAFSRKAATQIKISQNHMAHASEILEQISRLNMCFTEVPVDILYTAYSRTKGQRWLNAGNIMWDLITRSIKKR